MRDVLFVWTGVTNMFAVHMCTTLAQWLVSIDTMPCLLMFSILKMANEDEALMDIAEIGEI